MKVSPADVQAELDRVKESRCFRSRRAAQKFLSYIVLQTIEGHGKDINQQSIAVEGLGKSPDFDPSSNPLIRVQAGRLRRQLEEYYAGEGRENLIRIMLPIGSYQPAFMHRDEHQKFNVYAGRPRSPGTSQGPGLVCVPRLFSEDKNAGWATVTRLTRDYVISLTQFNCCQILFADENKSAQQVWPDTAWNEYEADFAMLFDLHDDIDGYNLKCSLTHSQTRQIVWAENYKLDKSYPDTASLQRIFRRIAYDTISLEQGIAHDAWARHMLDMGGTIQPQHHVMLALRQAIWDMSPESLHEAQQICLQRMETFPRDVQNLIAYADLFRIGFLVKSNQFDTSPEYRNQLASRLMRLAPGNAYTYLFQAFVNLVNGHPDACTADLEKSLHINPLDNHIQVIAGLICIGINSWDEGIALVQESMESSPVYPDWYHVPLALNYYRQGEYQQAMQATDKIHVNTFWKPALRAVLYRKQGMEQYVCRELSKLATIYPDFTISKPTYFDYLPATVQAIIAKLWSELLPEDTEKHMLSAKM